MSKKHFFHLLDAFQEIADMKGKGDWASQQIKEIKDKYENENDIFNNDDKKAEVSESFETNKEVIYFDNYQKRKAWDMLGLENLIDASYDDVVNFDWGVESLIENGNEIKWSLFIEGVDDLKILTQEELNNITPITDIKEKSPGKFYIGIWDDAKEDFIEFKEFNSFGDALKFASEYDYSGIKSGVVKFDTNSLFTKGFAGEFDIVDGDTDLDEMQRLMPIKEEFSTKKAIWPHELAKELRKRKKMGRSMLEIPNAGNVLVGNAIFNMAMGSDGGSSVGCSEGGLSIGGGTGVSESLEEEKNNHLDKCHVMKVVAEYRAKHNLPEPTDEEIDELISILEPNGNNDDKQVLNEIAMVNEDEVEDNGKIINTIQQCQKNPIDPTQSPAGKKLTTLQGVKEDKVLEEGAMADLDLKIKDVKKQIAETKDFLKFLRTQAPKEINKGGNFDSMEEVEEAIEENRNNLNTLIKELEDLEVKCGLR